MTANDLPDVAFAAALAGLARMTAHRLHSLVVHTGPRSAWAMITGEVPITGPASRWLAEPELLAAWRSSAARRAPADVWERCLALGLEVFCYGGPGYPGALLNDPFPPAVLFAKGDLGILDGRRVAVVGTRNATMSGRRAAFELGRDLAANDVHVVSGLARGVDGHAHRGVRSVVDALTAGAGVGSGRPLAVVASGTDVVYPREHAELWRWVATDGLLLTESPPGTPPEAFRFPLRNRIVAGLSEIVVVVESRERGGSLITASMAAERGVPVMAMPGGTHNQAALGVNTLLRDGSAPVLDVSDVLCALSLDHQRTGPVIADARDRPRSAADVLVYRACEERPRTIDDVADSLGLELLDAAMSLARLEQLGWVLSVDGWYETVGSSLR